MNTHCSEIIQEDVGHGRTQAMELLSQMCPELF